MVANGKIPIGEHGVNPSMFRCFYCGESVGVVLFGAALKEQAPSDVGVIDMEPCPKCAAAMEHGIILIVVRDGEMLHDEAAHKRHKREHHSKPYIPNPYRTGPILALKDEFFLRMGMADDNPAFLHRWSFIEESTFDRLGLLAIWEEDQQKQKETPTDDTTAE